MAFRPSSYAKARVRRESNTAHGQKFVGLRQMKITYNNNFNRDEDDDNEFHAVGRSLRSRTVRLRWKDMIPA